MQILRIGSPNLSYNIPHLSENTLFYLDGEPYSPTIVDVNRSYIQIPPTKNKFDEYLTKEGILLFLDEAVDSSTATRQPRVDENGVPIPSDVKSIESGLKIKLARFQKYLDFKQGYKEVKTLNGEVVTEPISKKSEKDVVVEQVPYTWEDFLKDIFGVEDTELWLHQEKKATTSQLMEPEHKGNRIGIGRLLN
jgi:hypothetical protein